MFTVIRHSREETVDKSLACVEYSYITLLIGSINHATNSVTVLDGAGGRLPILLQHDFEVHRAMAFTTADKLWRVWILTGSHAAHLEHGLQNPGSGSS